MTASPLITPPSPTPAGHEPAGEPVPGRHRRPFAPAPVVSGVVHAPNPDHTQLQIADAVLQLLRTVNRNGLHQS